MPEAYDVQAAGDRVDALLAESGAAETLHRITTDDLVSGLLIVHDRHPLTTAGRVRAALDGVRPYLRVNEGDVELLDVAEGVVRLRLTGTRHGCSSVTATNMIERAIASEMPAVEVERETARPLLQIGPRPSCPVLEASGR